MVKILTLKYVNDSTIIIISYYQYLKRILFTIVEFFCTADNRGTKVLLLRTLLCHPRTNVRGRNYALNTLEQ